MDQKHIITEILKEKEIDRMKSDFVSAVSHELRTPLTSIREAVALVAEGITGPVNPKQARCLEVALMDVDRLTRIVNDLLNLSKIEAGKMQMHRVPVSFRESVDHVISMLSPQAQRGKVLVNAEIDPDLPQIFADPDQMIQVLTNLLGNALKFTPAGGKISVIAGCPDGKVVEIRVKDSGLGIPKEDHPKLFQKFSQLDTGLKRRPGGTGLGLVISKEIVQRHGGEIWIESEAGEGATFAYTIPVFNEGLSVIELVREQVANAKELKTDLAVLCFDPTAHGSKVSSDGNILNYLEERCKDTVLRKNDYVLLYKGSYVLVIAETNEVGALSLVERIKDVSKMKLDYRYAVYPADGVSAEELIKKVQGEE